MRHPRNSVRVTAQPPPPPPHGSQSSGSSPYLARVAAESFSEEGPGGLHALSAETNNSRKEGRKEGGREVATQVNRRPGRDSEAVVNLSEEGCSLTPARPEGSVPSG